MQAQKFLKVLVVGLGVAIVLALGLVVYGVARLGTKTAEAPVTAAPIAAPVAASAGAPIAVSDLNQPIGTQIEQIVSYGDGRVAALLKGGIAPDRLVIIDLGSGKAISTIYVTAPDKAAKP